MKDIICSILSRMPMKSDIICLLHELMYQPQGNMRLNDVRKAQSLKLKVDARIVLMYCSQHSFVSIEQESIQLTDVGLNYYLANIKYLS